MSSDCSDLIRPMQGRREATNKPLDIRQEILRHHQPGRHCGSSAIRDLLDFHGLPMTEAMCLGLGCGLGITYLELPEGDTPIIVHVRSLGFEQAVFEAMGIPFAWEEFAAPDVAAHALDVALQSGRPALLLTDIFHLPYFGSRTHFPGHAVLAWGRNTDNTLVYVTDTERVEFMSVPVADLALARFSAAQPFPHRGSMFAPTALSLGIGIADAVCPAIRRNAQGLLGGTGRVGLAALAAWRAELPRWRELENWSWVTRFAYQVLERRGTGGGAFRAMYAEFLDEAGALHADVERRGLPGLMREAAMAWTNLAHGLRDGSTLASLPVENISVLLLRVEQAERAYLEEAILL